MQPYTLNDQQHATVLAALRYYQLGNQGDPQMRDDVIDALATNMGDVISLDDKGIDELYEHLQEGEAPALPAIWKQLTRDGRFPKEEMSPIQQKCWDDLNHPDPDTERAVLDSICEGIPEPCKECGEPADDGEGYDGRCGNCADRASCSHCGDPIEDGGSDGECSDCAEKAVEAASKRGMAMRPEEGLTTRTFKVPDGFNAEIGEFVVTENEPGSSHPPSDWVAWEVRHTFIKDGHKFADTVMNPSASEIVSSRPHHNLVLAWTNIKRRIGDA